MSQQFHPRKGSEKETVLELYVLKTFLLNDFVGFFLFFFFFPPYRFNWREGEIWGNNPRLHRSYSDAFCSTANQWGLKKPLSLLKNLLHRLYSTHRLSLGRRDEHDRRADEDLLGLPSDSDGPKNPPGSCPGRQTEFKPSEDIINEYSSI